MNLRTIEIDFDIHKAIEAERWGFEEPPHVALRRLLGLPPTNDETAEQKPAEGVASSKWPEGSSSASYWSEESVIIPDGAIARMKYQRGAQVYEGKFINGVLVVNGQRFSKLSAAANAVAVTRSGKKTQLNGWNYWEVKLPGEDQWQTFDELRRQARERQARGKSIF